MPGDGRRRDERARDDLERVEEARPLQRTDQATADLAQTQADADQLASDADQRQADQDQRASDRDQAVADWEHAHLPAAALTDQAHQTSRMEREAATRQRGSAAAVRSRTTGERLASAARRGQVSRGQDLGAAARDRSADAGERAPTRESAWQGPDP